MNKKQFKALAREADQDLNLEEVIAVLRKQLRQSFYEKALAAYLVYECHEPIMISNSCFGHMIKAVQSENGLLKINTILDRQS